MSPGSQSRSGEYANPVTQEQFNGLVDEFRNYTGEARVWMAGVTKQLSDGQAAMAVLRNDTASVIKRSDEASSKIRLLAQKDEVRAALEKRDVAPAAVAAPDPKPTVLERLKNDIVTNIIKLLALAIIVIGYHEFAVFAAAHPSISASGEGFTSPKEHEHERGREPVQSVPMSAPLPPPTPKPTP